MKKWLSRLLLFSIFFAAPFAHADDGGYGIKVFMQSPKAMQYFPGEIFSVSFMVYNQSPQGDRLTQNVNMPEEWKTIPPLLFPFSLEQNQNILQFFAIKIPDNYPSGLVDLEYIVQGTSHTSLYGKSSFQVMVLPVNNVEMKVIEKPNLVLEGDSYTVKVELTNTGNIEALLDLNVKDYLNYSYTQDIKNPIKLNATESKTVTFKFKTKKNKKATPHHYVRFELDLLNDPEKEKTYLSTNTQVLQRGKSELLKYDNFPIETMFVYGMKENKHTLFMNTYGKGYINEEKKKYLEFLFRLPIKVQTSVFTQLGGAPEKYYLKYDMPRLNFIGGDHVYSLSPLTINGRFGRGGSLKLKFPKVDVGTIYIHKTSAVKNSNFASFLKYKPIKPLNFSANFLSTFGRLINDSLPPNRHAQTYSLKGQYKNEPASPKENSMNIEAEYATNGKTYLAESKFGQAYYLRCQLKPTENVWFDLTKYYGNPNYVGYFQNQSQFNAALGFPIYKRLKGTLSYQTYGVNLDNNPALVSANKTKRAIGELTCSFPSRTFLAMSYNYYQSKNPIDRTQYHTSYGAFRLTQNIKKLSLQASGEAGGYHSNFTRNQSKTWQNYSLNLFLHANKFFKYTAYAKVGYENQINNINWTNTFGTSIDFYYYKNTHLQVLYEHSKRRNEYRRNFLQSRFKYVFPHGHTINFKGNVWNQSNLDNTFQFVIEYTIPWNAPIKRNSRAAFASGKVYKRSGSHITPFSNINVACNALKAKSNRKGTYKFPAMKPGEYTFWMESEPEGYVSEEYLPKNQTLAGGVEHKQDFIFVKAAKLTGYVNYFDFKRSDEGENTSSSLKERSSLGDGSTYVQAKGCTTAKIALVSEESEEVLYTTPNSDGFYSFESIRPGRWKLILDVPQLSRNYRLEESEMLLTLEPEEEIQQNFRILTKARKFKML
ncbi:MAG: hypothetical protein S4CHLAM37_00950 [Chlamydiia bacterium]|nr:hypothetical protein [Chlamydiia bacterium]